MSERPGLRDDQRYELREISSAALAISGRLQQEQIAVRRIVLGIDEILGEDYSRKFGHQWWKRCTSRVHSKYTGDGERS